MRRAEWLPLLCAVLSACGPAHSWPGALPASESPAVIVVLIDTLRVDHTSLIAQCEGRTTTPFLDQLAEHSWVFDRAYSAASWTRPSVASLITSRLPSSHGCEDRVGRLAPEVTTLAEVFHDQGWSTRAEITNGQIVSLYGFDQGFDRYEFFADPPRNSYVNAHKLTEPVLRAVDELGNASFFLYLHYVDPHDPLHAHAETDFSPGYQGPMDGSRGALEPYRWKAPEDPAVRQRVIDLYDGEILWMDHQLERLFGKLAQRGLLDRAWLVVTSDHGEGLWDHRIESHGQEIFEEQVRVPLLIRPPGGLARRVDLTQPISLLDVAPTLLDLVQLPVPDDFEGRSWAGTLLAGEAPPVRPIVIDEKLMDIHMAGLVEGDAKIILQFMKPEAGFSPIDRASVRNARYYDLTLEPREDLAQAADLTRGWPGDSAAMHRLLIQTLTEAERRRAQLSQMDAPEESEEQLQALHALGYLGAGSPPDPDH